MSSLENKSQMRASSESLSVALAADLMERLGHGSTLYRTTWKTHTTPSGRSLLRARSVGRPISETDCTGWPSPTTPSGGQTVPEGTTATGRTPDGRKVQVTLKDVAEWSGWPTPVARDHMPAHAPEYIAEKVAQGHGMANLNDRAQLVGPARLTAHGTLLTGSGAGTVSGGQLNPDLSRWLMGLPEEWARSMPGWQDWQMWQVLTDLALNEPKPTE